MKSTYSDILVKLEPYKDKAFLLPLSEKEIEDLEEQIGQTFPAYYKEYLQIFGVRQDFVIDLTMGERDYFLYFEYLPLHLKAGFVPVGRNNVSGDTLLLKAHSDDQTIYEFWWQGEGDVTVSEFSFVELVNKGIDELIEFYEKRPLNNAKNWNVQFAIKTTDEDLLIKTIDAKQTKAWTGPEISSADVYTYTSEIELASQKIGISRQAHYAWKKPCYYFNWYEPASNMGAGSFIKALDRKLANVFDGYTLIDYGVLPLSGED